MFELNVKEWSRILAGRDGKKKGRLFSRKKEMNNVARKWVGLG